MICSCEAFFSRQEQRNRKFEVYSGEDEIDGVATRLLKQGLREFCGKNFVKAQSAIEHMLRLLRATANREA